MWKLAVFLLSLGGSLIGLSAWRQATELLIAVFGPAAENALVVSGGILIIVGVALFAVVLIRKVLLFMYRRAADKFDDAIDPIYRVKPASPNELKDIFEMGRELLQTEVSSIKQMKRWSRINPRVFWVLRKISEPHGPIRGYFCVIPLKAQAAELVRADQLGGRSFAADHILRPSSKPTHIYIGAIVAKGFGAKGAIVHKLLHYIDNQKERGARYLLTRPVTHDGRRLVRKFKFKPLTTKATQSASDIVHQLDLGSN